MAKNYYIILGISRGADLGQIKKAYRNIAKKSHPDATRTRDTEDFREAREAYEILSNAESRRKHDDELESLSASPPARCDSDPPGSRASAMHEMDRFKSFADEFFDGFLPGIVSKPRHRPPKKDLYYEIILTPDEAFNGGLFPIRVPVIEKCPFCIENSRLEWRTHCRKCNGRGTIHAEREFSLSIPPRTRDATEVVLSLEDIGLDDVNLFLLVRIDPYADEAFF